MHPIINFHNDLLGCVEVDEDRFNFYSPEVKTSIPQMQDGRVIVDTLAIAAITAPGCTKKAQRQLELYKKLLSENKERVASIQDFDKNSSKTHFLLAIENASSILEPGEDFDLAKSRLDEIQKLERVLYLSLTWNHENIFGGGNASDVGLKDLGKELILYLDKHHIAIDFSHTSDALAYDILNFIDQKGLTLPLIASHSNFRAIKDVKRNLPDELALELIKRGCPIGLNFVRYFVGDHTDDFFAHIDQALKLGAEDLLVFGADFFGGFELPDSLSSKLGLPVFQPGFGDSSCYPQFIELLKTRYDEKLIKKICFDNGQKYLQKVLEVPV